MKKIYSILASMACVAGMSAATPVANELPAAPELQREAVKMNTAKPGLLQSEAVQNSFVKAPQARIPASESNFEFDTTFPVGANFYFRTKNVWESGYGISVKSLVPVEGEENSYYLDAFTVFSNMIVDNGAKLTLDPETGRLSLDTENPIGKVTINGVDNIIYLKGAALEETEQGTMIKIDPDAPVYFDLDLNTIKLSEETSDIFLATEDENGWAFFTVYEDVLIAPMTAVASETFTIQQSSSTVRYGLLGFPVGGREFIFENLMNFGEFNFQTLGIFDKDAMTVTFEDQIIEAAETENGTLELYLGDDDDNTVVMDFQDNGEEELQTMTCEKSYAILNEQVAGTFSNLAVSFLYDMVKITEGVEDAVVDNSNAPVEYFNLQGVKIANPTEGGIYIRRQGTDVKKIVK